MDSTYTLGTTPNNYVYTKQFGDKGNGQFSVSGLTPAAQRTMSVSYQNASGGTERSMLDISRKMPVPGSSTGETKIARAYFVLQRPSFMTDAEATEIVDALRTALANAALMTSFRNKETP